MSSWNKHLGHGKDEESPLRDKKSVEPREPVTQLNQQITQALQQGVQPSELVQILNEMVVQLLQQGRYDDAIDTATLACDLAREHLGPEHPYLATSLNNLATLYQDMGNYAEAESLYRQALVIKLKVLGGDHPDVVNSLNNLASLYRNMGDYAAAEILYRQAVEMGQKVLEEVHPYVAASLNGLATLYQDMGNYGEAEPLHQRVLGIVRETLGETHPNFATSLNNLAELYRDMGNYAGAVPLCKQALEIRRMALGEAHPYFAQSLYSLAKLYHMMGNYTEAEPLYRQALEIDRMVLGENHPDYATDLSTLALLYQETSNYAEAEPLYRQALKIQREALGETHPYFVRSLNNLAALYQHMGNYAEAEALYRQALVIKRKLGEARPDIANSQNNLAVLYHVMGNYAEAEPLYRQALKIQREALGETHPDVATSLTSLADLYAAIDREAEAFTLRKEAVAIEDRMIGQVFSIGSEAQRMAYLGKLRANFEGFLTLTLEHFSSSSPDVRAALDLVLRRKAIGAEAMAKQRAAVLGGGYPDLQPELRELTALHAQIAQKTLAGPGPEEDLQAHEQLLATWNARKERLEAELVSQIPEMNLEQELRAADRQAVATALLDGEALVEFVRLSVFDFKAVPAHGEPGLKPARYLTFVLNSSEPEDVQVIDLGEAEPIDWMIASFRASITGEAERDSERTVEPEFAHSRRVSVRGGRPELRQAIFATRHARPSSTSDELSDRTRLGSELRRALFDPLLPALGGRTRLFLAPDGDLARLPFEVLPMDDDRCLIDKYRISYLGVGRDVLRFGAESTGRPSSPLVLADPDFDLLSGDIDGSSTEEAPFQRLQGTREEGRQIARMLNEEPLLGPRALERHLKDKRSPRILHLATHGFFLPDAPKNPNEEQPLGLNIMDQSGDGLLAARLGHAENPLLRSGLALAGANTWLEGTGLPEEAEDGLLTAEDVTGMDLLATELVVLSACETGLGRVQVGEGVYGLRRAFILAGAKTLVMSLWKVPDEQTRELMEDFYERLLEGQPRAEALREAQLAMKTKHPDPLYWGAFICQGDPRSLPI